MVKTATQIQKDSDEKRGVKSKSYKLKLDVIENVMRYSTEFKMSQSQFIEEAIKHFIEFKGKQ